jgi:7-cyano-7-deazaguanine synthase
MNRRRALAVVLVSGGMDSCVTAAIAAQQFDLAMLHIRYGQRTAAREQRAFEDLVRHFRPSHHLVIELSYLAAIGGSSLTDPAIPVHPYRPGKQGIPASYVPFRNANFLAAAVSWCEVLGAGTVFIGAVEEDSSGYPDCRKEFYDAFNLAISAGTRPGSNIRIVTPVIGMSKAEIVARGRDLHAPFELTWSCYQSEDLACGACDSCVLRLRGFEATGIPDPLPYATRATYAGSA